MTRALLVVAALMLGACATPGPGDVIVGEWHGISRCPNLTLAPECKEEQIHYTFAPSRKGPNVYHLNARKMIAGSYAPTYETDVTYQDKDQTWVYPFSARTCTDCRWWYKVAGPTLSGGISTAKGEALRKVTAERDE